jgi:hypothetical protein
MARPTPRLARAIPSNPVTRPDTGIPVIATLHWNDGQTTEVAALATAWTRDAVEITWTSDWIPPNTSAAGDQKTSGTPLHRRLLYAGQADAPSCIAVYCSEVASISPAPGG